MTYFKSIKNLCISGKKTLLIKCENKNEQFFFWSWPRDVSFRWKRMQEKSSILTFMFIKYLHSIFLPWHFMETNCWWKETCTKVSFTYYSCKKFLLISVSVCHFKMKSSYNNSCRLYISLISVLFLFNSAVFCYLLLVFLSILFRMFIFFSYFNHEYKLMLIYIYQRHTLVTSH